MLISYKGSLYTAPSHLIKYVDLENIAFYNKHGYVSNFSDELEEVRRTCIYRDWDEDNKFYKGEFELISTMERNDVTYQIKIDEALLSFSLKKLEDVGLKKNNEVYKDLKGYLETVYDRSEGIYNIPVSFKNFTIHRRSDIGKYDLKVLFSSSGKSLEKLPNMWESDNYGILWETYEMDNGYDAESMDKQYFSMVFDTDFIAIKETNFLDRESTKDKLEKLLELRGYDTLDIKGIVGLKGRVYAPSVLLLCSFLGINQDEYIGITYPDYYYDTLYDDEI